MPTARGASARTAVRTAGVLSRAGDSEEVGLHWSAPAAGCSWTMKGAIYSPPYLDRIRKFRPSGKHVDGHRHRPPRATGLRAREGADVGLVLISSQSDRRALLSISARRSRGTGTSSRTTGPLTAFVCVDSTWYGHHRDPALPLSSIRLLLPVTLRYRHRQYWQQRQQPTTAHACRLNRILA